ncbi:hypothetical protein AOLI_G00071180 [Acnodon oligacanthus]
MSTHTRSELLMCLLRTASKCCVRTFRPGSTTLSTRSRHFKQRMIDMRAGRRELRKGDIILSDVAVGGAGARAGQNPVSGAALKTFKTSLASRGDGRAAGPASEPSADYK